MVDFHGLTLAEMRAWAESIGLPAFRGEQLFQGLWKVPAPTTFAEIKGLPTAVATRLDAEFTLRPGLEDQVPEILHLHTVAVAQVIA